jgi:hypothetical protein
VKYLSNEKGIIMKILIFKIVGGENVEEGVNFGKPQSPEHDTDNGIYEPQKVKPLKTRKEKNYLQDMQELGGKKKLLRRQSYRNPLIGRTYVPPKIKGIGPIRKRWLAAVAFFRDLQKPSVLEYGISYGLEYDTDNGTMRPSVKATVPRYNVFNRLLTFVRSLKKEKASLQSMQKLAGKKRLLQRQPLSPEVKFARYMQKRWEAAATFLMGMQESSTLKPDNPEGVEHDTDNGIGKPRKVKPLKTSKGKGFRQDMQELGGKKRLLRRQNDIPEELK